MTKIKRVVVTAALIMTMPLLAGCPETEDRKDDTGSCNVLGRAINSAGQAYLSLDCDLNGTEDQAFLMDAITDFPKCNPNTYYPACKEA